MSRIVQSKTLKGSQKWLQYLINNNNSILNLELETKINFKKDEQIEWLSPLQSDHYAEYQDESFINRLGTNPQIKILEDFWPKKGPVWDGLGKTNLNKCLLIEAKSHIDEIVSPSSKASVNSLNKIRASLLETQNYLNIKPNNPWDTTFYQFTNRIAHLYFLRVLNSIPAYLIYIYFTNDTTMDGPKTIEEWKGAIKVVHSYLGIGKHKLSKYILEVFFDVTKI